MLVVAGFEHVAVGDVAGEDVAMHDATSATNNDSTPTAARNNHGAAADRVFEYRLEVPAVST